MLTRCNGCGELFYDEEGLNKVVETSYLTGRQDYEKYENRELIETDECWEEVINACPNCLTDDFLMDLGDMTLKEVSEELNYRENSGSEVRWNDSPRRTGNVTNQNN